VSFDFSALNPEAWTVFIVGWIVVFVSLTALSYIFKFMPDILGIRQRHKEFVAKRKEQKSEKLYNKNEQAVENQWDDIITGELTAAISYALHLYFDELHDEEQRKLTVVHKSRKYSPWNSKIYNVMNFRR
jgi:glutaconyl-CoA/methylmalonyl-CoA decarboxylase subunit delta